MAAAGSRGGRAGRRPWLIVAALVLAVACLVPPVSTLAGRYVVAETVQFTVFALVVPGLFVLGAAWPLLRLARPHWADGRVSAVSDPGLAGRLAAARQRHPSFMRSVAVLAVFGGAGVLWRLPAVVDEVARHGALAVVEMASLLISGTALWLEIVPSPPLQPRGRDLHRAGIAAGAMWLIWIVAYVLGLANRGVFHAFSYPPGAPLSPIADQELATAVMWAVAGACFVPVIFTAALSWLREGEDVNQELDRMTSVAALPAVKGWERRTGGKHPR